MTEGSGLSLTRRGERVTLRPLDGRDLPALESWYEAEAARQPKSVGRGPGPAPLAEAGASAYGHLAVTHRGRRRPIGVMTYRVEDAWFRFEFVAVEAGLRGLRGLGLDSEAVRLVEEDAVRRGLAQRFWAGVRRDDGLGLYFWLRLGYRPARPGDVPWKGDLGRDIMAMVRHRAEPRT